MFDWDAAEEVLYRISTEQVARFLGQIGVDEVYGFGFFCDPSEGIMLVANTREHLEANIPVTRPGRCGGIQVDIGDWEHPARPG